MEVFGRIVLEGECGKEGGGGGCHFCQAGFSQPAVASRNLHCRSSFAVAESDIADYPVSSKAPCFVPPNPPDFVDVSRWSKTMVRAHPPLVLAHVPK